jgi:LysR family transcriptional regulator, glycine cleavage system transcriptional activator
MVTIMRRTLPSFRALESFEAVARCGNVTRAADELGRTQSAVSRQIANLEEFARRELFVRDRKHLVLNNAGRVYYQRLVTLLDELEAETVKLVAFDTDDRVLRLGVLPTFGSRWLMPRLTGFAASGSTELHLVKGLGRDDFDRQNVDAAIECCNSQPLEVIAHHLLDEEIVAVIAPTLHQHNPQGKFDKLHMPARSESWKEWVAARGSPFTAGNLKFDNYSMMIEAACLGFGVAVLPTIYVAAELASGRLIAPFGAPLPSGRSYWLTYQQAASTKHKIVEFSRWLLAHKQSSDETRKRHAQNSSSQRI